MVERKRVGILCLLYVCGVGIRLFFLYILFI